MLCPAPCQGTPRRAPPAQGNPYLDRRRSQRARRGLGTARRPGGEERKDSEEAVAARRGQDSRGGALAAGGALTLTHRHIYIYMLHVHNTHNTYTL